MRRCASCVKQGTADLIALVASPSALLLLLEPRRSSARLNVLPCSVLLTVTTACVFDDVEDLIRTATASVPKHDSTPQIYVRELPGGLSEAASKQGHGAAPAACLRAITCAFRYYFLLSVVAASV